MGTSALGREPGWGGKGATGTACTEGTSNNDRSPVSEQQPKPHDPPRAGTAGQHLTEPCLSRSLTTADTFPSHPCSPQQLQDSRTPTALWQRLGTVPLALQTRGTVPPAQRLLQTCRAKAAAHATQTASTEQQVYLKHDLQHDLNFTSAK